MKNEACVLICISLFFYCHRYIHFLKNKIEIATCIETTIRFMSLKSSTSYKNKLRRQMFGR